MFDRSALYCHFELAKSITNSLVLKIDQFRVQVRLLIYWQACFCVQQMIGRDDLWPFSDSSRNDVFEASFGHWAQSDLCFHVLKNGNVEVMRKYFFKISSIN